MDETLLKIGEIAAFFGVSPKAMRIYEKKGLISPSKIDPSTGYRYYLPGQVLSLNVLVSLKSVGFSLAEIQGVLLGTVTVEHLLDLLSLKTKAWRDSAKAAEDKVAEIDHMVSQMSESKPPFKLGALSDEQRAWLLSKMVLIDSTRGRQILSEALWL